MLARSPTLRRTLAALGASLAGTLLVGALSGALRAPMDRLGGAAREAALFTPLALVIAAGLVPLAMLLSAARVSAANGLLTATPERARASAAGLLLAPPASVLWVALAARAGQFFLTAFHNAGLAALFQAVALFALTAFTLAAFFLARAITARALARRLATPTPARALALGLLVAVALAALGVRTGSIQGRGILLGAFGVLKIEELDLAPVYALLGAFALGAVFTLATARNLLAGLALLLASGGTSYALLHHAARHFSDAPSAAVIEARPGLARTVLRLLRKRADRDHDGASALYGGGDCNDRDPRVGPNARDIPGNGIDEDCSGSDAVPPRPPPAPPPPSVGERLARETPADMNLVVITIDTLRWDLHYAGNPRPLSPNLDRLAAQSVVFDHGYAISSYTGKSVGPLMIGRYPTECARNSAHFTEYLPSNVYLAERLRDAGFRTMGAASHFYFERRFGLTQGVEQWDISAEPAQGQETVSADARVADRAIAELLAPENRAGRFMLWAHFFDPHKQYVAHPEIPAFADNERGRYDAEVAWTDRQVGRLLDALDAQPFASRTVVVVTADHGEAFGEHNLSWHGVEVWDVLQRVPWIMRVPGISPRHVATPRSHIDLVPTLLQLLRVPAPAPDAPDALSGVSLVPDLLGEPAPPRPIYIELPEGPYNSLRRAVIDGGWKLVERGARRWELYHLDDDPGELRNLAAEQPEQLQRMQALMEQLRGGLHEVRALPAE